MPLDSHSLYEIEAAIAQDKLILPSPPDFLIRIRQILDDDNSTPASIAALLATDPGLSARILKVANSALYRRQQEVETLQQAISSLGFRLLKTLVTSHVLMQAFIQADNRFRTFLNQLQHHSLMVAKLAWALASRHTRLPAEDALLAGMIHDIGYLPMIQNSNRIDMEPDEQLRLFRQHHSHIGALLLEKWHFPAPLILVAQEHENRLRQHKGDADLVDIVIIANLLVGQKEDGTSFDPAIPAFAILGVDPEGDIFADLEDELKQATGMLGV